MVSPAHWQHNMRFLKTVCGGHVDGSQLDQASDLVVSAADGEEGGGV